MISFIEQWVFCVPHTTVGGVNMNQNYDNSKLVAYLFSVNNSYSYKLGKHHSLNASIRYTGRTQIATSVTGRYNTNFNEFMGTLAYRYNF